MTRQWISSGSKWEEMAGYSRAVVQGDWIFVSGTVGWDREANAFPATTEAQARCALDIVERALGEAGASLADTVRVVAYLPDRADLSALETSLPGSTSEPGGRREAVQKVIAQSRQLLYVFLRTQVRPNLILVTLCRADANLGMAMMVAREALEGLEKLATER